MASPLDKVSPLDDETAARPWESRYWNGAAATRWVEHQERLDRAFEPFARAMLERAALQAGEHVLDVGCGCGATTLAAASQVGGRGTATGIDLSAAMLARARTRAEKVPNARFACGDAGAFAFDRRFDACVSRFGVMFFPDPVAAFRHLGRALRPGGGRVAFVCWRRMDENPWVTIPLAAVQEAVGTSPAHFAPDAPGPFSFGEGERLERALSDAGLNDVRVAGFEADVLMSTTGLDEAVTFASNAGPAGRVLAEASPGARASGIQALAGALRPYARTGTVSLRGATWVATARAP